MEFIDNNDIENFSRDEQYYAKVFFLIGLKV